MHSRQLGQDDDDAGLATCFEDHSREAERFIQTTLQDLDVAHDQHGHPSATARSSHIGCALPLCG